MQKTLGYFIIGSLLVGTAALWPIGLSQADETNQPATGQKVVVIENKGQIPAPKAVVQDKINRGELAEKLVDALHLNLDGYRFFKAPQVTDFYEDVDVDHPAANAIMILGYHGFVDTSERHFEPEAMVTREELAELLGNILQQNGQLPKASNPTIQDLGKASGEAAEHIKLLVGLKILGLNSDGNFQPKQGITANELKAILKNLQPYLQQEKQDVTAKLITGPEGSREVEISWGEKPSSGYQIHIVDLELAGETLVVHYQTKEPNPGSYNSTVITEPKDSRPIPADYPAQLDIQLSEL